jgi:predicted RND superfamily exporter protein
MVSIALFHCKIDLLLKLGSVYLHPSIMNKILARFIIVVVLAFTAVSAYFITQLKFDYEFENFFPTDDPDLDFYKAYMEQFSPDVDFVLLGAKNEDGIFEKDFLERALEMQKRIEKLEKVKKIISPFNSKDYALGPFGPIAIPYMHPGSPEKYVSDSTRIYTHGKGVGSLFSPDGKSISMLIEIQEGLSKVKTDTLYYELTAITDQYSFDEFHLSGKAIGQAYYIERIKYEFAFFFTLGIFLILGILILIYRSFWGVAVPLIVVLLSVVWLLGIMGMVGKAIDIMTILLPLVLFVVGIADVIHLLSRYFEEIRNGLPKFEAIKVAYKQVGMATFLTSITTAMGFLTLVSSSIRPVRDLGIFAAIGVFVAFFLAFSLLPAILALTKIPKLAYKEPSSLFWNKIVGNIFRQSIRNPIKILATSATVIIVSIIGISMVEVDNFLLEDVGEGDPTRNSFEFFENNFAGVRPFDLYISSKDTNTNLLSEEVIDELLLVEGYLKNTYGVGFMISPLNLVRTANQALNGGRDSAYVVPDNPADLKRALGLIRRFEKRPEFSSIIDPNRWESRFSGKIKDSGGKITKEMNEALVAQFTDAQPLKHIDFKLTGMALLIDKSNETLSVDMMSGLFLAIAIVALVVGILFRSVKMALISVLPNVIPLLVIGGIMGFLGIDLKVATSIIFGIAFGIAVDDSIHYLSKYRLERKKGRTNLLALRRTSVSTGKAIILTSLILCAGFFSLATSDFKSTFYVGMLISVTLLVAVLADLYLLPVLLMYGMSNKKKRK